MRAFAAVRRRARIKPQSSCSRSMQIAFRISLMRAQPIFQLSTHFGSDSLFMPTRDAHFCMQRVQRGKKCIINAHCAAYGILLRETLFYCNNARRPADVSKILIENLFSGCVL
jgi:hypothetical protein